MVKSIIFRTQNSIISAAFILSVVSALSTLIALFKSRVLIYFFGVGLELSIFNIADRIPNFIFSILYVGALSTVFIPIFTEDYKKDPEKGWETASNVMSVTLLIFFALGSFVFIFSKQIFSFLVFNDPNNVFSPTDISLGANLMRIMLLAQLVLVFSSFILCLLQSFRYFLITGLAPVFYNVGMFIGTALLSGPLGIYGPAWGVMIGALLHLAIQIPLFWQYKNKLSLSVNFKSGSLKKMFLLVPPRIGSVALSNFLGTLNNSFAILISASAVNYLKFSIQLQNMPVYLFGISMASASLPTLSEEAGEDNLDSFKRTFITTLHQTLFLVVPVSVVLLVLRIPVVRIVYGTANFPWEATVKTSYALAFFSLSIFSQSVIYLLSRAFYALKDMLTPVKISFFIIVFNVFLTFMGLHYLSLGVWYIALTYSFTSIVEMFLLLWFLNKKVGTFNFDSIAGPFIKICYSGIFMGITLYAPVKLFDQVFFDTTKVIPLLFLTGMSGLFGGVAYLFFTYIFKVEEIRLFYKLMAKFNIKYFIKDNSVVHTPTDNI